MNKIIDKYKKMPVQVKASFWFLICAFLQKGISFITTPIFTRLLSASEYGQYNVFTSWLSVLTVIVTFDLFYGVYIRGLVVFSENKDSFSSSLQGLTLTLTVAWTIIYLTFHKAWNNIIGLNTIQMLLMLLIMWTSSVFCFWSTKQRVDFKYRSLVVITLISSVLKPIVSILLIHNSNDKVMARIIGLAIVELFLFGWMFFSQMYRGKQFINIEYWKHALTFNIPLIPHYLSSSILSSADRIMINSIVGEFQAGIYSLAYSISMIMVMMNTALMQTIEPWMYKKINEDKIEDISKVAYFSFILVATVNILLIAFAPEAVRIFAPSEYYEAIYVIPPVAMSVFFMFSYTFFAVFEFYFKKTKKIALATSTGAILNIILNYVFIRLFGYYAAGYTTLLCYIIYALLHMYFMRRICNAKLKGKQPYDLKIYFCITILFLIIGFLFLFTYSHSFNRYILIVIILLIACIIRKQIKKIVFEMVDIKRRR